MSYTFWNNFVARWSVLPVANYTAIPAHPALIGGWQNPNGLPLYNSGPAALGDYSLKWIPEPWWGHVGNYSRKDLHSVVINFNPGMRIGNQRYRH